MNYQKIYTQLIERAQSRILDKKETYFESHHIIPRCMGGSDEPENLVNLTAREHFLVHYLLIRIYPKNYKLAAAFFAMCNQSNTFQHRYIPSSSVYQEARELFSISHSSMMREKGPQSEEHKLKNSQSNKGRKLSEETKQRMRKPKSEETKKRMSESFQNRTPKYFEQLKRKRKPTSEETKQKQSLAKKGKKLSAELREKYIKNLQQGYNKYLETKHKEKELTIL